VASDTKREEQRRATIRSLFHNLPGEFEAYCAELKSISSTFHEEMAHSLEPVLNAEIRQRPHGELREKQKIASSVNELLRSLRLAIRCPKTGGPAALIADWKDSENDRSRFRIALRDAHGRSVRTFTSYDIPDLKLREDRPRNHHGRDDPSAVDTPGR
jgi:hypothetical protein